MKPDTVLLIIDMQNDVLEKAPLFSEIVPELEALLKEFRAASLPVIHIRRSYRADGTDIELPRLEHYKKTGFRVVEGTKGAEIIDQLKPVEGDYIVVKPRWSGFFQTSLELYLKRLNIKTVVLTGVQTPNCVRTTAYDAIALDYETIVISDCSAAASKEVHEHNLQDMDKIGVRIMTKSEFLEMI